MKILHIVLFATIFLPSLLFAQQELNSKELSDIKQVYVPSEQLSQLIDLKGDIGGILAKSKFEELLAKEIQNKLETEKAPRVAMIHSADFDVNVDENRLVGTLTVSISVFGKGWKECQFDVAGWNVESATLEGQPAAITRDGKMSNTLRVFLNQVGAQKLKLKISAPLQAQGGDKALSVSLPGQASGEFRITLPAGKYLEAGNSNFDRPSAADQSATYVLPIGGQKSLSLKITDRQKSAKGDVLTFASTAVGVKVFPSEITWAAQTELQVFGREIDKLTCLIPNNLEITAIESTGLESWELADAPDSQNKTLMTLQYRQGFDGRRAIQFRGILSESPDTPWSVPALIIPSVNSHTGAMIIQHPHNLRLQAVESVGVRTVNEIAIPSAQQTTNSSAVYYQIWEEQFRLRFVASLKRQEIQAAMTNILDITQSELNLYTTVSIETRLAPLFDFRLQVPNDWDVSSISVDNKRVQWQAIDAKEGIQELRIPMTPPLTPGQTRNISLLSRSHPDAWPVKDETHQIAIPEVLLPQVDMLEALYGISAEEDFEIVTQEMTGLDPAGQKEIQTLDQKLNPLGKSTRLAYTYQDTEFSGKLDISRKPSTLSAETVTFFRVDEETLFTRLEALLEIGGGGYRELNILISESAGENLRFDLIPVVDNNQQAGPPVNVRLVEQIPGEVIDGFQNWALRFDRYLDGEYRLMTEVRIDREAADEYSPVQLKLPVSEIVSGYIAVEGATDEHVQIQAIDATGTSLGIVDPVDFPPAVYRPQQRMIAGYRHIHPGWEVKISVKEFDRAPVPTVIGHSSSLNSVLSKAGQFQHEANISFVAIGAQSLIVKLPDDANLWATLLDGVPVEIRQSPDGLQIPVTGLSTDAHQLQLSYSTTAPELDRLGEFKTTPPTLNVIDGQGQIQPVEILTQDWQLHLPDETLLISSDGRFEPVGRLLSSTFFSDLLNLFRIPTERSAVKRAWILGWAIAVLLIVWFIRRTVFTKNVLTGVGKFAAIVVGAVLFFGVCVFFFLPIGLSSKADLSSSSSFDAHSELEFDLGVDELADSLEYEESLMEGSTGGEDRFGVTGGMPAPEPASQPSDLAGNTITPQYNLPQRQSTSEAAPQVRAIADNEMKRSQRIPKAEFESGTVAESRERNPNEPSTRLGIMSEDPFEDNSDLQFRQGSFDLAAPSFGGFDPGTNVSRSTLPNGLSSDDFSELILPEEESADLPEQAEGQARVRFDDGALTQSLESDFGSTLSLARSSRRGRMSTGGLLSMTFDLQIPEGTRIQRFHYQGNGLTADEVNLRVRFANRTTGQVLIWSIALGMTLLGWWFRNGGFRFKFFWLAATILLPLSLAWVVPVIWQLLLEGLLYGGFASLCLWSLRWSLSCFKCCCGWLSKGTCPASLLMFLGLLMTAGSSVSYAQPVSQMAQAPQRQSANFVVIPYNSLDNIDAADRIWVPQEIYRQLWQNAHPEDFPIPDGPVPAVITEANYNATVEQVGETYQVITQARWVVAVLSDQQVGVTLPVRGSAISSATIDGNTANLDHQKNGTIKILLRGRGIHVVDAQLRNSATINGEVGEFSINLIPVASGVFNFSLPDSQKNLRVRVDGLSRVYRRLEKDDATIIQFPIDRGGMKTVNWYPEAQQGGQNQLVQVETAIAANFDDTGINVSHGFQVRVRQGAVNELTFQVPAELAVRDISGQDIGGWEMNGNAEGKELKIFFRREIDDQSQFQISLYQNIEIGEEVSQFSIPTITPLGVSRETIQLGLYAANHLRLRVTSTSGLSQVDVSRYQPVFAAQQPDSAPRFAYRSSSRPLELNVAIERRESEAKTEIEHGIHIARRKQFIATRVVWQLTGSPRRSVNVSLPADYLPISVVCADASDWYVHEGENGRVLSIEFPTPKLGRIEAGLEGHLPKAPDDESVELTLPQPLEASGQTASLGIWMDSVYRAAISQTGDWNSIRPNQLSGNYRKLDPKPVQFAFRSTEDAPNNVILNLQTAVPKLTSDIVTLIAVSDATIDYGTTLRWKISQAAADTFTFTAPDWLTNIEINGVAIREIESVDLENNRKRWTVSLVDPVRDQYLLSIAATIPAPLNKQVITPFFTTEIQTAEDSFSEIQIQQQYAILVNLSPSQLVPVDLEQFESIPLEQIPITVHQELVQQAMEITRIREDKIPSWNIQRMEELAVAKAVVLSAHLETVLELDGSWRTLATYGVRNRGRQFLALEIPENARILSVFVRGKPSRTVLTEQDKKKLHLVALPQTSAADLSFDVKVLLAGRFERSLTAEFALRGRKFSVPAPNVVSQQDSEEFGLPVTQTLWTLHLPESVDANILSGVSATNLTPHATDAWLAIEKQTLERLKADVSEMARLVNDKSVSKFRRMQAQGNLKQLNRSLVEFGNEYYGNDVKSGESAQLRDELFGENKFLQAQTEKAVEEVEAELSTALPQKPQSGRGYILDNNSIIISNNGGEGIELDALSKQSTTFNFLDVNEAIESKPVAGKAVSKSSRSKLKSQIAGQQLQLFDSPPVNIDSDGIVDYQIQGNSNGVDGIQIYTAPSNSQQPQSQVNGGMIAGGAYGGQTNHFGIQLDDNTVAGLIVNDLSGPLNSSGFAGETVVDQRGQQTSPTEVAPWSTAGGLSIQMDLPKNSKTLSFSKVGGSPALTISVQAAETNHKIMGLVWCILSLIIGLWVLKKFSTANSISELIRISTFVAIVISLVGFFFLPSHLVWVFFWIFCLSAFVLIVLSKQPTPNAV